jgi:hypothetical protein
VISVSAYADLASQSHQHLRISKLHALGWPFRRCSSCPRQTGLLERPQQEVRLVVGILPPRDVLAVTVGMAEWSEHRGRLPGGSEAIAIDVEPYGQPIEVPGLHMHLYWVASSPQLVRDTGIGSGMLHRFVYDDMLLRSGESWNRHSRPESPPEGYVSGSQHWGPAAAGISRIWHRCYRCILIHTHALIEVDWRRSWRWPSAPAPMLGDWRSGIEKDAEDVCSHPMRI